MELCYMCERPACSKEHVPPRCIFPEEKDVPGEDFRKNLITVPSCEFHNFAKSRDDEFLMISLAGIIGNNSIGFRHKFSKVNRAIRRNSKILLNDVFVGRKKFMLVEYEENKFIDCIWGTPNYARLNRCFDHVVRGLYFHHFGRRFQGKVKMIFGYLAIQDVGARNFHQFIKDKAEMELAGKEKFGDNSDVFYYQISDTDQFGLSMMRLCFYGGVNIYVALMPESATVPKNFAFEIMNRGIKTVFRLGDKEYEIN